MRVVRCRLCQGGEPQIRRAHGTCVDLVGKRPLDGVWWWPPEKVLQWLGQGDSSVPFTLLNYVKNFHVYIYHVFPFSVLGR